MTDSERLLWSRIRLEQFGVKFRRQHPIGSYICDFACLAPKLVIELDGSQHADNAAYDKRRDEYIQEQGFVVLRFGSNEPFANLGGVLTVIFDAIATRRDRSPPSQPSPGGGRS